MATAVHMDMEAYSVLANVYTHQTNIRPSPRAGSEKIRVWNVLLATRPTDTAAPSTNHPDRLWQLTIPAKLLTAADGIPTEPLQRSSSR